MLFRSQIKNNIESRTEDAFTVTDSLDYNVGGGLFVALLGNIFTRTIDRETRYRLFSSTRRAVLNSTVEELKINGSAEARYTDGKTLSGSLRFSYQERDERHTALPETRVPQQTLDTLTGVEERKNSHVRQSVLASTLSIKFSSSHSLSLSGSGNILRYDTPSLANNDDRDELLYLLNLTTDHRFNKHLSLRIVGDVSLNHLVYLSSRRSGDNTWNRVFRFAPRASYTPFDNLTTTNSFEVLANYTAYDYENGFTPTQSFVFRQFSFVDSSIVHLTRKLSLEWFNTIRLYERGELQWSEFTERPLHYFIDKTYLGTLHYQMQDGLLFSIGFRYFSQARYRYSGSTRNLEQFLRSVGPVAGIRWNVGSRTDLRLHGWYERQTQTSAPSRGFTTMTMSLTAQL